MTIYATPFKTESKECNGSYVDYGVIDIDSVIATMGKPISQPTPRYAIYGDDENRVIFSRDLIFHIDGDNNIN